MNLRVKITLLTVSAVLVSVLLTAGVGLWFSIDATRSNIDAYLRSETNRLQADLENWLTAKSKVIEMLASSLQRGDSDQAVLQSMQRFSRSDSDLSDIYIGYESGRFLSGSGWQPPERYDPRFRPWYLSAKQHGGLTFSEPYLDMTSGKLAVSIGMPLVDRSGNMYAVLGEDLLLETLSAKISNEQVRGLGYAILMDMDGVMLSHPDQTLVNRNLNDHPELGTLARIMLADRSELGRQEYRYNGEDKIIFYARVPSTQWVVGIAVREALVYRDVYQLELTHLGLAVLFSVLIIGISTVFSRRITRRLSLLKARVDRIADGTSSEQAPEEGTDEIAVLSGAFNRMKRQIGENIETIHNREEEYRRQACTDSLTGLPNRRMLLEQMTEAAAESSASVLERRMVLLMLDMDDFKNINDSLGHEVGDELLILVADSLREICPNDGMLARIGGDEFAILVRLSGGEDVVAPLAVRILERFARSFMIGDTELFSGICIGIAMQGEVVDGSAADAVGDGGLKPDDAAAGGTGPSSMDPALIVSGMMKNADAALFKAKKEGKSTYRFFDDSMRAALLRRIEMESGLRRAIERDELHLMYQPIQNRKTKQLRGFEALIRWTCGEQRISPGEFIPVAEEIGLIGDIGEWALKEACQAHARLAAVSGVAGESGMELVMSVNLSPIQIKKKGFVERVREIMEETGMRPDQLELEITEGIFIDAMDHVRHILQQLRALGIRLAMDDFGTGFSSLANLKSLPIDTLKLDRSFIESERDDASDRSIVVPIISLAHSLGLDVVAEGVETEWQYEHLSAGGCDFIQGFFLYRPMPEADASRLVRPKAEDGRPG